MTRVVTAAAALDGYPMTKRGESGRALGAVLFSSLLGSIFDRLVTEVKLSSNLSQAEIDTLRCIRDGMTHKEIAEALQISPSTVKVRIEKARAKLGAASSAQALAMAIQQNLL